jgi:hypothetical protein
VSSSHGQSFSRNHFSTSRWPPSAAYSHVLQSHGQSFSRNHFSTSRWPFCAAFAHVHTFHGHPFSCAHFSTSRWPPFAARAHVSPSHGNFSAQRSAFNASRSPDPRSRSAQETLFRQSTSSAQTLERAHVSAFGGILFTELLHLPSGRIHSGAHPAAHRAKHREVRGVGQVLLDERDGDIEGQARDRDARLRGEISLSLARTENLGGH